VNSVYISQRFFFKKKDTIVHCLALSGSLEGLALLSSDLVKSQLAMCNVYGQTPLHLACRHAAVGFVAALLSESLQADVGVEDKDGTAPIYYASAANKDDIILLLKSRGALFREERVSNDLIRFEPSNLYPKIQSATIDALVDCKTKNRKKNVFLILFCLRFDYNLRQD
jgi:ankyrin repeat protein